MSQLSLLIGQAVR